MTQGKKQARALCGTAVARDPASEERFAEITSGRSCWQRGLVATRKDSSNEAKAEGEESQGGLARESAVAMTKGQCPSRRRNTPPRGNTSGEGTLGTGGSIGSAAAGHRAGGTPTHGVGRDCGPTPDTGAHAHPRLNPRGRWESPRRICQGFEPDLGKPAVRGHRGASGNVTPVSETHLASERRG